MGSNRRIIIRGRGKVEKKAALSSTHRKYVRIPNDSSNATNDIAYPAS